jgi:hypothetical protein
VRELRELLERMVELAPAELLRSIGDMGCLFEQACGIRDNVDAMGGSLAGQFFLNLGLDINNDSHRRGLALICPETSLHLRASFKVMLAPALLGFNCKYGNLTISVKVTDLFEDSALARHRFIRVRSIARGEETGSSDEVEEMIGIAQTLQQDVEQWIRKNHAPLL